MPANAPRPTDTLIGIELGRFSCALAVLFWHYQHFYYLTGDSTWFDRTRQPGYSLLWPFFQFGYLAVPIFWAFSGFIFFHKYAAPIAAGQVPAARFALLRFSRLYPLHFVTLLLAAALQSAYLAQRGAAFVYPSNDLRHFGLQLFLASSWGLERGSSFNGPVWSISVEVLVYALFFAASRLGATRVWSLVLLAGGAALVSATVAKDNQILRCVFFFYLGALTSVCHRWLDRHLPPRRQSPLRAGAVGVLLALFATVPLLQRLPGPMVIAPFVPLAILLLIRLVRPKSQRTADWIVTLGNTTYSSYLLHFPIQLAVAVAFARHPQALPLDNLAVLFAFVAFTIAAGIVCFRRFERPAQDWIRRRFPTR